MLSQRAIDFDGLPIMWGAGVLEPRPWTAIQSHWAAELSPRLPVGPILELCAGAGHIGLLAATLTQRPLVQVELDPVAALYARHNADTVGAALVDVRCGAMALALDADERFPLILADPPYLRSGDTNRFPDDPIGAIDGGASGLDRVEEALHVIAAHLAPSGACLLQAAGPAQIGEIEATGWLREFGLALRATRVFDAERAVCLLERDT